MDPTSYTLAIQVEGQRSVIPGVDSHRYEEGTVVNLTATLAEGWKFKEWVGDVADAGSAETTVVMDSDKNVKAVFEKEEDNGYIPTDPGEQTSQNVNGIIFNMRLAPASIFPTGTGEEPSSKKNEPVTGVNWYDSIVWCNELSEYLGGPVYMIAGDVVKSAKGIDHTDVVDEDRDGFRLPTSMEWELAARYKVTTVPMGLSSIHLGVVITGLLVIMLVGRRRIIAM